MTKKSGLENAGPADIEELRKSVKVEKNDFENVKIFALYDKKGEKFDIPFFAHNELFAKRKFIMMAKEESILKEFLDDFELAKIGSFNIITGFIKEEYETILEGIQIRKESKNEISNEA